jgi:hypothetical protein
MPCKKYLSGSKKNEKKKPKQVCGSCRKLALQIKIVFGWGGGGHHTIFAMDPLIPSYATAFHTNCISHLTVVTVLLYNIGCILYSQDSVQKEATFKKLTRNMTQTCCTTINIQLLTSSHINSTMR